MNRHLSALLSIVSLPFLNCSCGSFKADVTNPTVAQMDALDVQWGLTPRKPKGGARRDNNTSASSPAAPIAGAATQATIPQPAVVDPSVIQSLR